MKTIIHVNQHVIRKNTKHNENNAVLTVKTYLTNEYAKEVVIFDENGKECAKIIYSKDKPLSCGARVWIETSNKVEILNN
jgi:hypothetical protein